jgi:RimJ/RimL family protein N-acetyltransferase
VIARRPLNTARLVLEPIGPEHSDGLWKATEPSLRELRPWLVWAEAASPETTAAFAAEAAQDWEEGRGYHFAILETGEVLGALGVDTPLPVHRIGDLGYWIRTDRAGRGYTTEAARAATGFGFGTLGLYRMELRAGVDNLASQRVAEKLGFRREGRLRRGCPGGQGAYDCYLYGLLAEDDQPAE